MNKKKFKDTAKKHVPKQHRLRNATIAFITGGIFAIVAQLIMEVYRMLLGIDEKSASTMAIVTIILISAIMTGLGIYDKAAQYTGAGMFVPISGFANSLTSCAMEGKSEGLIYGIGGNMFKLAGSVLTYGIASAFVFGFIRFLLFGA